MSHNVARTPDLGNQMLETAAIAGSAAAMLTMGLVEGVWRLVAWVGRQQLASDAARHCGEADQFVCEMTRAIERLASELGRTRPRLTPPLFVGLAGLRERGMWFIEDNYKAFVLGLCGTQASAVRRSIGEWIAEPLRHGLDATRSAVGREFNEKRHAADRKRLNELIRRTENELVESAFRVLHADIVRPGELAGRKGRRLERFLITLVLGILTVAVFHFSCFPEEWISVWSSATNSDKQRGCKERLNCGFPETWNASSTPQSHRLRAHGGEHGRRKLRTIGARPSATFRCQPILLRHLE